MTAARAEDSSTIALLVAKAATRDWTARLLTARGSPEHLVDERQGVVGEQGVGASGDFQTVGDVVGRFALFHPDHRLAQCHSLVEGGEGTEADPAPQYRLSD